jgi:hypothetical protein
VLALEVLCAVRARIAHALSRVVHRRQLPQQMPMFCGITVGFGN